MNKKISKIFEEAFEEFIEEKVQDKNIDQTLIKEIKIFDSLKKEKDFFYESFESLKTNDYNDLPEEMWLSFSKSLQKCCTNDFFIKESKKAKAKVLVKNYFNSFKEKEENKNIENILKVEMKKYYRKFNSEDVFDISYTIFHQPFSFQILIIEYCENLNNAYKESIKVSENEFNDFLKKVKKEKAKLILNINDVSLGKTDILSLTILKSLFDVDAFSGKSNLDLAVLEYINRLLYNEDSCYRIKEQYGFEITDYLKEKVSKYPNYLSYLKDLKKGLKKPFFYSDGTQKDKGLNFYLKKISNQI